MSELGGHNAFPVPGSSAGMTYRKWLTGQVAKGALANTEVMRRIMDATGPGPKQVATQMIVDIVDDLLNKLDKQ